MLHQTVIEVENIKAGRDLSVRITRAKMEQLCMDLFKQTLVPVQNVLKDAELSKKQVRLRHASHARACTPLARACMRAEASARAWHTAHPVLYWYT